VVNIHDAIVYSHKKNETPSFAATWMELDIIMLNDMSQAQKDKHHVRILWKKGWGKFG
jgi:hypothetical protein